VEKHWLNRLKQLVELPLPLSVHAEDFGELSANPFNPHSTSNPFGAGSPLNPDGLNNPFRPYGSPFSNQSATNPFATDAPRLHDQQGNYRGELSTNQFDPDSTSNPHGRYVPRSRRTPSTIHSTPGIPTNPAVPRVPTGAAGRSKDANPAAEPLHVISWLLDT
jgi:hypothetical protein